MRRVVNADPRTGLSVRERGVVAGFAGPAVAGAWLVITGPGFEVRYVGGVLAVACVLAAWQVVVASRWRRAYMRCRDQLSIPARWREN